MRYQNIFFDLDGTLTASEEGITKAVQYALEKLGVPEPDLNKLRPFIGPPLMESFGKYYTLTEEQSERGCAYYREYYDRQGKYENQVYPGIPGMLDRLREKGHRVCVVTAKGENFARDILDHFDLTRRFDDIVGQKVDGLSIPKADLIRQMLEQQQISELSGTVMVGDRENDMTAAAESGVHSIGALYGYGSLEELREAGAERIAGSVAELEEMLLEE